MSRKKAKKKEPKQEMWLCTCGHDTLEHRQQGEGTQTNPHTYHACIACECEDYRFGKMGFGVLAKEQAR
jgi:hypothetical protein